MPRAQSVDVPASAAFGEEDADDVFDESTTSEDTYLSAASQRMNLNLTKPQFAPFIEEEIDSPSMACQMLPPEEKLQAYEEVCADAAELNDWDTVVRYSIFNTALARLIHHDDSHHIEIARAHWKLAEAYLHKGLAQQSEVHANRVANMIHATLNSAENDDETPRSECDPAELHKLLLKAIHTRNVALLQQSRTSKTVVSSLNEELSLLKDLDLEKSEQALCVLRDLGAVHLARQHPQEEALKNFNRARKLTWEVYDDESLLSRFAFLLVLGELCFAAKGFEQALGVIEDAIKIGSASLGLDEATERSHAEHARALLRYGEIGIEWLCCEEADKAPQEGTRQKIEEKIPQNLVAAQSLLKRRSKDTIDVDYTKVRLTLARFHLYVDDAEHARKILEKELFLTTPSAVEVQAGASRLRKTPQPLSNSKSGSMKRTFGGPTRGGRQKAVGRRGKTLRTRQGVDIEVQEDAEIDLERCKFDPSIPASLLRRMLEVYADALALSGDFRKASQAYTRAIRKSPKSSEVYRELREKRKEVNACVNTDFSDREELHEYLRSRFGYPRLHVDTSSVSDTTNADTSPATTKNIDPANGAIESHSGRSTSTTDDDASSCEASDNYNSVSLLARE